MRPVNAPKDFLTNCYTREGIFPFLKKMEEEFLTSKKPFSLLIVDVDHFKSFNDKFGHLYGDEVLKYFSSSLRLDLEDEENVPFRFGGDEFIMVFPNKTPSDAHRLAMRLRKNIRTRSCLIKGRQISVTFSGGIASYPGDANTVDDILEKADKALYYSKNHGRSRITKYGDLVQKELLQIGMILTVLAIVGALFYFYRDHLSSQVNRITPWFTEWVRPERPVIAAPPETSVAVDAAPAEPELPIRPPAQPPAQPPPAPDAAKNIEGQPQTSEIELESGRIVKGVIRHEDDDVVEIEVGLQEGKGMLQIKRSQIVRIDREPKTA